MQTLTVSLPGREYDILIESGLIARAGEHCRRILPKARRCLVVTDENVGPLYLNKVLNSLEAANLTVRFVVLPAGEGTKCLSMLGRLYDELTALGVTRTDFVLALGGGVIGDLAGFAAATILRGIALVQIPTTLLAQVDSSVGGKVAIDLPAGKNLAGAFWQPSLVLIDPKCLDTLPDREFAAGMAEVIKYGCIRDRMLFDFLAEHAGRTALTEHLPVVIRTCCAIKAAVVLEDERDTGVRRLLNYGHTLGHAVELAGNFEKYVHGEAVAVGMCMANRIGEALGITPKDAGEKLISLLQSFDLPTFAPCPFDTMAAAVRLDKKNTEKETSLILLDSIGSARAVPMATDRLLELAAPLCEGSPSV